MIYRIETQECWQQALQEGEYLPATFEEDGFIHCSALEQVVDVANNLYHGQQGLVLLCISQRLLQSETLWELAEGLYYPHIYGPLNLSAVTAVVPFPCGSDGTFALPPDVPEEDEPDSADA